MKPLIKRIKHWLGWSDIDVRTVYTRGYSEGWKVGFHSGERCAAKGIKRILAEKLSAYDYVRIVEIIKEQRGL